MIRSSCDRNTYRPLFRSAGTYGILALGAEPTIDDTAMDLAAAALVLTDHIGPAARVMSRHRGTPSKDWDVPEAIAQLPYLPSIESAVDLGYKRLIIDPLYTKGEAMLAHASARTRRREVDRVGQVSQKQVAVPWAPRRKVVPQIAHATLYASYFCDLLRILLSLTSTETYANIERTRSLSPAAKPDGSAQTRRMRTL